MVVTKETNLGEILDADPTTAIYFMQIGNDCLGSGIQRRKFGTGLLGTPALTLTNLLNSLTAHFAG